MRLTADVGQPDEIRIRKLNQCSSDTLHMPSDDWPLGDKVKVGFVKPRKNGLVNLIGATKDRFQGVERSFARSAHGLSLVAARARLSEAQLKPFANREQRL